MAMKRKTTLTLDVEYDSHETEPETVAELFDELLTAALGRAGGGLEELGELSLSSLRVGKPQPAAEDGQNVHERLPSVVAALRTLMAGYQEDLIDLVNSLKDGEADQINDKGAESQLEYILDMLGPFEAERVLREMTDKEEEE